jgi:hypothetical protein
MCSSNSLAKATHLQGCRKGSSARMMFLPNRDRHRSLLSSLEAELETVSPSLDLFGIGITLNALYNIFTSNRSAMAKKKKSKQPEPEPEPEAVAGASAPLLLSPSLSPSDTKPWAGNVLAISRNKCVGEKLLSACATSLLFIRV